MKNLDVKKQIKRLRLSVKRNVETDETYKMMLTHELKDLETFNRVDVCTRYFNEVLNPLLIATGVKFTTKTFEERTEYGYVPMTTVNV